MNVDTKTKVVFKFGGLEILCVDMRSKKLLKLSHFDLLIDRCKSRVHAPALTPGNSLYFVCTLYIYLNYKRKISNTNVLCSTIVLIGHRGITGEHPIFVSLGNRY